MPTDQVLLDAVNELKRVVEALTTVLHEEYPKRKEIEAKFTTKRSTWRRVKYMAFGMIAALIASFFVTVTTVSVCFLGSEGQKYPVYCNVLPGYQDARDGSDALIQEFRRLQELTSQNQREINRLRREVRSQ